MLTAVGLKPDWRWSIPSSVVNFWEMRKLPAQNSLQYGCDHTYLYLALFSPGQLNCLCSGMFSLTTISTSHLPNLAGLIQYSINFSWWLTIIRTYLMCGCTGWCHYLQCWALSVSMAWVGWFTAKQFDLIGIMIIWRADMQLSQTDPSVV